MDRKRVLILCFCLLAIPQFAFSSIHALIIMSTDWGDMNEENYRALNIVSSAMYTAPWDGLSPFTNQYGSFMCVITDQKAINEFNSAWDSLKWIPNDYAFTPEAIVYIQRDDGLYSLQYSLTGICVYNGYEYDDEGERMMKFIFEYLPTELQGGFTVK